MVNFIHDVLAARIVFGADSILQVVDEVERLNATSVMLVSGGPEAIYADQVSQLLGGLVTSRFTDVVMHIPVDVAAKAIDQAKSHSTELLLAVGGGSSIGMAKAVAKELHIPILAIPTTYAGSEMTPIWGLTEKNRKTTGRDRAVLPVSVIYDPNTTLSLPVDISMASGMNALAHLIEAMYAPDVSPISTMQAKAGITALARALPAILADPQNIDARSEAMYGSCLAGWALGTNTMGVHHKICHTLGGTFNLPHAQTHSAVISYSTSYNELHAPAAMANILDSLRASGIEADSAGAGVWQLATLIEAPTCLADLGFTENQVPECVEIVVSANPANPRPVEANGVRALLQAALKGKTPTLSVA